MAVAYSVAGAFMGLAIGCGAALSVLNWERLLEVDVKLAGLDARLASVERMLGGVANLEGRPLHVDGKLPGGVEARPAGVQDNLGARLARIEGEVAGLRAGIKSKATDVQAAVGTAETK